MPLINKEDCALGDLNADLCVHCCTPEGKIKSCEEIFEGGVQFFIAATGSTREEAEKLCRKNMKALPYWNDKKCKCFEGPEATDAEFQAAMAKLA